MSKDFKLVLCRYKTDSDAPDRLKVFYYKSPFYKPYKREIHMFMIGLIAGINHKYDDKYCYDEFEKGDENLEHYNIADMM
jgi:hypothetical protein